MHGELYDNCEYRVEEQSSKCDSQPYHIIQVHEMSYRTKQMFLRIWLFFVKFKKGLHNCTKHFVSFHRQ